MDETRFDALARSLAGRPTRRTAFRLLAGGLLGGLLCRQRAAPTRAAQIDDVGALTDPGTSYTCASQGLTDCGGFCADLTSDPANCGACGNVCAGGDVCVGWCETLAVSDTGVTDIIADATACAAGLTDCGGVCVDLATSNANCGACFTSCPLGGYCNGGKCVGTVCFDGLIDCGVGYCVDTLNDAFNCGTCGVVCPHGPGYCVRGICVGTDPPETGGGGGSAPALDCGGGKEQTDEFGRKTGFCDAVEHAPERPSG